LMRNQTSGQMKSARPSPQEESTKTAETPHILGEHDEAPAEAAVLVCHPSTRLGLGLGKVGMVSFPLAMTEKKTNAPRNIGR
jgi:hypothetical protein